ncbi:hypothetical protein ACJ6WF_49325 [Streptomyces sp. MMS24-I2-30]|uniref:hypothetical protein n=1 Tax=Streptomyces sp. MMS24-I2-30 TaxID=3351564 RepID=UPI003896A0DE
MTKKLFQDALSQATSEARMCTELDAPAMPGITFWSRANRYLAEQLTDPKKQDPVWKYTRRDSILRVVHPAGSHAITAVSGAGGVGDPDSKVRSKNPKGRVMAQLVEDNVKFERSGQAVIASRDEIVFGGELDSMPLWFLLYGRTEDGRLVAELSLPVKMEGKYVNEWSERIPLFTGEDPGFDLGLLDSPDEGDGSDGGDLDFEVKSKPNT